MTPTMETWRAIPGYEGLYEVSDQGRVCAVARVIRYRTGRRESRPARVLKPFLTPNGRRSVHLTKDGRSTPRTIYSLVLEAFVGPRPTDHEACHNNGEKTDDRLANLRWDTKSANALDQVRHGTHHAARRTECRRGHALAAPNLVPFRLRRGERDCLACHRAKCTRDRAKRLGRDPVDVNATADIQYRRIMEGADLAVHDTASSEAS